MELKTYVAQDATGAVIPGAKATLYTHGTTDLAQGVTDAEGNAQSNPMVADANGVISFMAPNGKYDLQFALGPVFGPRFVIQLLDVTETLEQASATLDEARQVNDDSKSIVNAKIFASDELGRQDPSVPVGGYYAVPAAGNRGAFTYYCKTGVGASTLVTSIPTAAQTEEVYKSLDARITYAEFQKVITNTGGFDGKELLYCVRDADGYQTWIGVSLEDGGPSAHAERMIRDRLGLHIATDIMADDEQLLWAVVDADGNLTDLAVRAFDGQLADFAVRRISARMLSSVNQSISSQLDPLRVPRDAPGYQTLASMTRWAAQRGRNGSVSGPIDFTTATNRQNARLTFPSPYAKDDPMLLVLYFGGVGSGPTLTPPSEYSALNNDGIIWARCNYEGDHYGSPKAMQDVAEVYEQACKLAPVGGVVLLGNSMGGMGALNALLRNVVPGVLGLYLTDPVANLWDRYNSNRQDLIKAAYGINSAGTDYSVKTAGYDPMLRHWSDFRGVPVYCIASSGDTLVPMSTNAQQLYDTFSQHLDFVLVDKGSAGHNSADRFDPTALRAFLQKCASGSILK